jgi:hypothetical protein
MVEPGLNRHESESEMASLEDDIHDAYERGSADIAAAVNGYRAIFDHLAFGRSVADAGLTLSGEPEA